jgi:HTH-type transcriptional regulator / antitoxin HipB
MNEPALIIVLQNTRKELGLSREALSGLAGVSTSFIRDAETHPSRCSLGLLLKLCEALGLHWQMHGASGLQWPLPTIVGQANTTLGELRSSAGESSS